MASTASTRDLSKAINAFLPTPTLPLPDELAQVIEGYLEKHERYDVAAAERLHEELLSIYHKSVQDQPARYAPFLAILRQLRPAVRTSERFIQWWDKLVEPVLDHLGHEKGLASEAIASTIDILTADDANQDNVTPDSGSLQLANRLLGKWMHMYQITQPEGKSAQGFKEKLLRETVLQFAKKRPKTFMAALDIFLIKREFRSRSLTLLCEFIQSQPPHLHMVQQTSLFDNILRCLQLDTSTTGVSLALTALIMLLPNMPSSLVKFLPTLFNIYARLLFWDRERTLEIEGHVADSDHGMSGTPTWEKCTYSRDIDGLIIPHLQDYFTILYGLYPLNFVDYIRKPERYLRHANAPNADDIEVQPSEIRHRSERFRQCHTLHPNFYNLTVESEKTDFSRWIKSEAAEVVASCMALCLASDTRQGSDLDTAQLQGANSPHLLKEGERDGPDQALLSGSAILETTLSHEHAPGSWRHTQSTAIGSSADSRANSTVPRRSSQSSHDPSARDSLETRGREAGGDSPTLPPHLVLSPSHTQLQDMINSNKVIKSGFHQSLANDSVPSLALSHQESIPEKSSAARLSAPAQASEGPTSPAEYSGQLSQLYKQILLLNNDLTFERYMKQQHMIHIGELRRRQVREAATEAETQNLIMANRNLKHRLEEAKKAEMQAKKESENRRTLAKNWEKDLSAKLKTLREEQKKWTTEGAALRRELEVKTDEAERLTKIVCEFETKELNAKQSVQVIDQNVGEHERLKAEVTRLTVSERTYQAKEKQMELAVVEANESSSRAELLQMQLTARESELQQTKALYQSQIVVLQTKLQEALKNSRASWNIDTHAMIEKMLADSRAKQSELQKQYSLLMRKYTVLQSSLLDMTANANVHHPGRLRTQGLPSSDPDAEVSAIIGSPISPVRTRSHRGFSDAEPPLGTSHHATPPFDSANATGTSAGTVVHRPATPTDTGLAGEASAAGKTSPSSERYYGRGGVQNTVRKEKKKEEPTKKDKKSSGIQRIRGFV